MGKGWGNYDHLTTNKKAKMLIINFLAFSLRGADGTRAKFLIAI